MNLSGITIADARIPPSDLEFQSRSKPWLRLRSHRHKLAAGYRVSSTPVLGGLHHEYGTWKGRLREDGLIFCGRNRSGPRQTGLLCHCSRRAGHQIACMLNACCFQAFPESQRRRDPKGPAKASDLSQSNNYYTIGVFYSCPQPNHSRYLKNNAPI